jgi:dienelactone hydrolase
MTDQIWVRGDRARRRKVAPGVRQLPCGHTSERQSGEGQSWEGQGAHVRLRATCRSRRIGQLSRSACCALMLGLGFGPAAAPAQPGANAPAAATEAQQQAARAASAPDGIGDGPFPASKQQIDGPPHMVVYHPANLAALASRKMPIYIFGNGACSEDGASARQHLLQIASHGYLAIALGGIYSGPSVTMTPDSFESHRDKTRAVDMGSAINWAIAENKRAGSPFQGRIDTGKIALSGFSCGGIQALKYAGDARVTTFVIMNSGILDKSVPQSGEMAASKGLLDRLSVPSLYVLGGSSDIAYPNGMDDFKRLTRIPVAVINTDVGHGGTYDQPNGGRAAKAVVAWLDWQLRGDAKGKAWFVGPDCTICKDPAWTIERRNF